MFKVAAKLSDVTLRRGTESFFVLAAEVRGVFIAHMGHGARRVQVFAEQQAELLLLFIGIHNAWDKVTHLVFVKKRGKR